MNFFKNVLKKTLIKFGYELHRIGEYVTFKNFQNLARAYEHYLHQADNDCILQSNDIRIKLLARLLGTPPFEAYFIVQGLAKTKDLSGDVCEFGVAQGETSALIANEIQSSNKTLHLFDSFEGLPKPTEKDQLKDDIFSLGSMEAYEGTMSSPETMVRIRLSSISFPENRTIIHKGFIDKVLKDASNLPQKVSFAYVDFDFYEPIKMALEFLHRTTPPGAIIVVDDYDFFSTGAKSAVDEFLEEKNSNKMIYECFIPDKQYGYFAVISKKS